MKISKHTIHGYVRRVGFLRYFVLLKRFVCVRVRARAQVLTEARKGHQIQELGLNSGGLPGVGAGN